ncbi:MAG TPA: DUF4192 domain-containing protein [Mycobacteriales bacterium]|nr:DUF4192 domain-containing protein [Mycobacteriales bacterium]
MVDLAAPGPATLALLEPADVIAAVPYLLGYRPDRSVIVLALSRLPSAAGAPPRSRLRSVSRTDIPAAADAATVARELVAESAAEGVAEVVVVVFGRAPATLWPCLEAELAARRIGIRDALRVEAGRWWSHLCADPACCPPDGTPVLEPTVPGGPARVAATLVAAGLAVLPSRQALSDLVRPDRGLDRLRVERAVARAGGSVGARLAADPRTARSLRAETLALLGATVRGHLTPGGAGPLPVATVARLVVGVHHPAVFDRCGRGPEWTAGRRGAAGLAVWAELLRRAPAGWSCGPGLILAAVASRYGDAPLARAAASQVRAAGPMAPLAGRLARLVDTPSSR